MKLSDLRSTVSHILFEPPLLGLMERIPVVRDHCRGWRRTHPIDRFYGVNTSGFLPVSKLNVAPELAGEMIAYAGSVPSILRRSFDLLPDLSDHTLVDLGCGKGRSLVVASEFPFKRIVGVEASERVAKVARRNAKIVAERYPDRTPIEVVVGDATTFPLGRESRVVYFLYHPFEPAAMERFVAHLTTELTTAPRHAFVVYCNPVVGQALDNSPAFARWSAETLTGDPSELGFGPDSDDTVVIWQSVPTRHEARPGAGRAIVIPPGETHAVLRA